MEGERREMREKNGREEEEEGPGFGGRVLFETFHRHCLYELANESKMNRVRCL